MNHDDTTYGEPMDVDSDMPHEEVDNDGSRKRKLVRAEGSEDSPFAKRSCPPVEDSTNNSSLAPTTATNVYGHLEDFCMSYDPDEPLYLRLTWKDVTEDEYPEVCLDEKEKSRLNTRRTEYPGEPLWTSMNQSLNEDTLEWFAEMLPPPQDMTVLSLAVDGLDLDGHRSTQAGQKVSDSKDEQATI